MVWCLESRTSRSPSSSPALLLRADNVPLGVQLSVFGFYSLGLLLGSYEHCSRNVTEYELSTTITPLHSMQTQQHLLTCCQEQESHTFPELCWTNKLAVMGCSESGTRWAPRCFCPSSCPLLNTSVFHADGRPDGQVEGSLAASLCSFILYVRSVAWTSNKCRTEIPMWNLNGPVDILNVN